jgi:rfaE bifunctional protein kinase chain/domain
VEPKIVFVSGHFNVLHPGHLRLLRFAKEFGGKLIVAVESDKLAGSAAHVPELLRLEGVQSNSWVDETFLLTETVTEAIKRIRPDIVVKGKEFELKYNPEQTVLEEYGGRLIFSSGETIFSSLDLIRLEFLQSENNYISIPKDYLRRHDLSVTRLIETLHKFSELHVCVIGDLIIDEYITCQPLGMSQEDPTIVVTPVDSRLFIGGAGIVAAHAAGLGANVDFISVTGVDKSREFALAELEQAKVRATLMIDESRPTTLKQRYRSHGKTLLRVSHLHQGAISFKMQEEMIDVIASKILNCDLLVFSDFNYGCLPQAMVDKIIAIAKNKNTMIVADSQSSSQLGDIGRFKKMDLLTPTEHEARISTRNQQDGLVILAEELKKNAEATNILLKMGVEGLLIHAGHDSWLTDRIDALNSAPKDVSGAGDSLLIASSMALASGGNIWEAALLGAVAAAVQVGRVGNIPIKAEEILKVLS